MLKRYRKFTGLFLILIAATLLFAWEARGRDMILMQDVCVAKIEIQEGQLLAKDMLKKVAVPRNAIISGAILPGAVDAIVGKRCIARIPQGAQISERLLADEAERHVAGSSSFVIDKVWIFMRSSSLRAGDRVEILTNDGLRSFGIFNISYVKDEKESEVRSAAGNGGLNLNGQSEVDRSEATAQIDHVEIETILSTYLYIKSYAETCTGSSLLLVRRE